MPSRLLETLRLLPRGLIGTLALILLVEAWLSRHELLYGESTAVEWGLSALDARTKAQGVDLLCFGDSLILTGIQPRILHDRLGRSAYNLAVPAGQAPTTYFLLRSALESGARPRAIVAGFSPYFLGVGPARVTERWPLLLDGRDVLDLGLTANNLGLAGRIFAARQLPSLRNRFILRTAVRLAFAGASFNTAGSNLAYRRNRRTNHGATVAARRDKPIPDPDPNDRILSPHHCRVTSANRAYLHRFFELTQRHGVPVFWVLPPYLPVIHDRRVQWGAEAEYTEFVRSIQDRYPHVVVMDARESNYPAAVFSDFLHLDRDGASVLSADVAEAIARSAARLGSGSRWVTLPPFRPCPDSPELEDFEQSRLAVKRVWNRRRR